MLCYVTLSFPRTIFYAATYAGAMDANGLTTTSTDDGLAARPCGRAQEYVHNEVNVYVVEDKVV